MNIWLKEFDKEDGTLFLELLNELSAYPDVYARPTEGILTEDDFKYFKEARIKMKEGVDLPKGVIPTTSYWVMCDNLPIGYSTLKHYVDLEKPGGHFGCCLKKEYQNKGIGKVVSELLSKIAYEDYQIEEVVYTAKKENVQSQKSLKNIGAEFISERDGYYFYIENLKNKFNKEGRK